MIRQAELRDREDIQRLNQQIFDFEINNGDPMVNTNFSSSEVGQKFFEDVINAINGHIGYVFEDGGVIKGYMSLRVQDPSEYSHRQSLSILQIQTLGVDEHYRGQSIGRALINHAKQVAKDLGFSHLRVVALAGNNQARHVYKECGFHEQEIIHEIKL